MQLSAVPNHRHPSIKTGPIARWYVFHLKFSYIAYLINHMTHVLYRYLPVMALIGIGSSTHNKWRKKVELTITGFGLSSYYLKPNRHIQTQAQMAEEERLQRNRQLIDAYGDRDSLKDVERALAIYEVQ